MSGGLPLEAGRYDTDKSRLYLKKYEQFFAEHQHQEIRLLELGIRRGGSLRLWRDFFERGLVVGVDIEAVDLGADNHRIRAYQGDQGDLALLDRIRAENAPGGFDIIIDDASHLGDLSRRSFWHLFTRHLRPGGIYVVEDWRVGYWEGWPDGRRYVAAKEPGLLDRLLRRRWRLRSHDYGMVGFVKELVDELGMDMITLPSRNPESRAQRLPMFQRVEFHPGQVFVVKATEADDVLIGGERTGAP